LGGNVPIPNRLQGLGSVVKTTSGVQGGAPAANAFFAIFEAHITLMVERTALPTPQQSQFFIP